MLILPKHERQIDGGIGAINQTINSEWAIAISCGQNVTVCDRNFSPKYEYQLPDEISCLAISPKGDLLAAIMANGNHLAILTAENQIVFEEQLPNPPVKHYLDNENGFQDCWFDADGLRFWCMKLIEMKQVEIQICDTSSWQIQRQLLLKDPLGAGSSFSFHPHPENHILALYAAAGQHGQQIYWLYDDGTRIHAVEVPCLYDTAPPKFHPAGGEFVVINNYDLQISRFSFPDCNLLGICECPCPDSDDWFRYSMCYLSDDRLLIDTNEGLMYLIDLNKMEISDEVILSGHEPRPSQELYPNLNDEEGLCSDLDCFYRFDSDSILSVHSQLPSQEPDSKQKTLVIFGGKELFGSLAKVQKSAPYSKLFIQSLGIS
ncbi:hypothetical protein QT971_05605 [Microcoleus sp. herbarium19]|uniref:hypothetical protein n=1 Tax=unclassified Microcoleus TaxID=2642155 RepID=UPI002FD33D5B